MNSATWIAPAFENIPKELQEQPWAVWVAEPRAGKTGKFNKAPRNPTSRNKIGADKPHLFGTFEEAKTAYEGPGTSLTGVGVLLTGTGIVGVDLDDYKATFNEQPEIRAWANQALEAGIYCERSPSGTGLRLFMLGKLPSTGRKNGTLEIYDNARFLTVTGHCLGRNEHQLVDGQKYVDSFLELMPPATPKETSIRENVTVTRDTTDLVDAIVKNNPLLWVGKWQEIPKPLCFNGEKAFPSQSEADFALCGAICREALQSLGSGVDDGELAAIVWQVFRESGLYRAEKEKQVQKYAMPKLIASARSADPIHAAKDDGWLEPEEIKAILPPVPPYDERLLPPVFRAWIRDIAERMQCPIEYLAVGALVAAGSVVGNRIGVQPKKHDNGWIEVPNLWGGAVGRPGVMKSPALAQVLAPLRRLERAAQAAFTATKAQYEIDRMVYEAQKKQIETQIKKGATVQPGQLPVQPEEPQPRRHLLNDSTYQKLGQILGGNPQGLMVFQDELSGLLMRLDSTGQESSRAFYLEAWNGQQSYTFDRIERGTVSIPRLCFSLLGGLQPSKLREYLRSAVYGGKGDDGLAQRLQMLVYPDIAPEWVQVDRPPDLPAFKAADAVFDRLANLNPAALGARMPMFDGIPILGFDDAAQDLFNLWWSELENNLRSSNYHPALESHISKYRKLVPALALLDHLIIGNAGDVTKPSLVRAIKWQEFLFEHAKRAYAAVTSATMDSAKALSQHVKRGALRDGFTVREVYRHNWSMLGSVKETTEAAEVLVDLGWLRAVKDERVTSSDGRPTVRFYINPRLKTAA